MGFIYGLAVFLVIFEGIIIECEGAGGGDSSNTPPLPNDAWETILRKTDDKTRARAALCKMVDDVETLKTEVFQDHIILITPRLKSRSHERWITGELFMKFQTDEELINLFKHFGDHVKKVEIWDDDEKRFDKFNKIMIDHIKIYGKNFEELRIFTTNDVRFWEEILDGEEKYDFPKVKNLRIDGTNKRKDFKLNVIFPKLEIFTLHGRVVDENCLANIKTLRELMLDTLSIREDQFEHIFRNNNGMRKLCIKQPRETTTMHLIAEILNQLETLTLMSPDRNFLLRENNNHALYQLQSVFHFDVSFFITDDLICIGNPSFVMPHLKKLTLNGNLTAEQIVNFVKHFEELETVEIFGDEFNIAKCIEKLKDIKEFTTRLYGDQLISLKTMVPKFDKHFKLQILKFRYDVEDLDKTRAADMMKFKKHLEKSMKST